VHVFFKCQIFSGGQSHARGGDALDRGVVGKIDKEDGTVDGAGLLEALDEEVGLFKGDAHGGKHDREGLLRADNLGLARDLRGELGMRQAGRREDRQLLAADQRGQSVDGGNAGVDVVTGIFPHARIQRHAVDVQPHIRFNRSETVDRTADSVEGASEDFLRQRDFHRMTRQTRMRILQGHAFGAFKDLNNGLVFIIFNDAAELLRLSVDREFHDFIEGGVFYALENNERAVDLT